MRHTEYQSLFEILNECCFDRDKSDDGNGHIYLIKTGHNLIYMNKRNQPTRVNTLSPLPTTYRKMKTRIPMI